MGNLSQFKFLSPRIFLLSLLLFSEKAQTKMHEFETSRLKSSGGAGVGSILLEESAFLNPSSSSFFNTSSLYYQRDSQKTSDNINTTFPKDINNGFVLADGNPELSGTLSYIIQKENDLKRKRWGASLSAPMSDRSTFGVSVRKSSDIVLQKTLSYYQTVFGVTHTLNESSTLGLVLYDPFKSKGDYTRALVGIQSAIVNYVSANVDVGADYTAKNISSTYKLAAALQIKVWDDFFIRVGGTNDKALQEKGEGFGIAWIQPKLAFEFAVKNTRSTQETEHYKTMRDISFSVSLRGI